MSRRLVVALIVVFVPACGGIGVREVKRPALFADWRASALVADKPSPRTVQTLRIYDLDHVYDRNPDEAIRQLHATAVADPQPDTLFALAELQLPPRPGRRQETSRRRGAALRALLRVCAAFPAGVERRRAAGGGRQAAANREPRPCCRVGIGLLPATPLTPRDAFDPRFRLACDLYNAGLAQCLRAAQKVGRLDPRCALRLPAGDGGEDIVPVVHTGFAWKPEEFGPLAFCEDYEVVGLANQYRDYGLGVPLIGSLAPDAGVDNGYYASRAPVPGHGLLPLRGRPGRPRPAQRRPAGAVQPADDPGRSSSAGTPCRWKPT